MAGWAVVPNPDTSAWKPVQQTPEAVPTTGRLNMPMHQAEAIQEQNTPVQAESKRDELGSIFPAAGATAGGLVGSIAGPIGTAAGGAYGGVLGENLKAGYEGKKLDPVDEVKSGLLGALPGVGEEAIPAAGELIPTRAKAGAIFDSLKGSLANTPVPLKNASSPLLEMAKYGEGGAELPGPASKLLTRSQATFPMNYPEARIFQETLGTLSRADRDALSGSQGGNLKQLNKGLYDDIRAAASRLKPEYGDQYENAMNMYRNASLLHNGLISTAKKIPYIAGGAAAAETAHKLLGGR